MSLLDAALLLWKLLKAASELYGIAAFVWLLVSQVAALL